MINHLEQILSLEISPNQYYILYCLHNEIDIPSCFTSINAEIRILTSDGYLKDLKLTAKGLDLFGTKKKSEPKIKVMKVTEEMIKEYLNLFPPIKLPSGKYARAAGKNIESQFTWFFKTYNYDWKTVLKATGMYIDEYETKNFLYMKTSYYFISKTLPDRNRDSELANYCAMIESGIQDTSNNFFSEKVV